MTDFTSKKRNIYLNKKTLEQASQIVETRFDAALGQGVEQVATGDAVGRVLSAPVHARISSPNFHASAMDGIALKAKTTFGVNEAHPKTLAIGTDAFYVNTGHVMPPKTDAVIMIENVQIIDKDHVRIEAPAFPWQYVRKMGEDIVATELLFPHNHVVTPYCIGALLSGGIFEVQVKKRPRVLIIPTGSELVPWRKCDVSMLTPGQVIESNSAVLGKLVESCGAVADCHDIIVDDFDLIEATVSQAVDREYQMVLIIGGSSAGSYDFSKDVIQSLGQVLVHGVTIMPGKPIVIGKIKDKPVFGMPGYPVSAIISFEQFVKPLLSRMSGQIEHIRPKIMVEPVRNIPSKLGVEEFIRVKLGKVNDRIVAATLPRGAGTVTSITRADGIIRIPTHSEGITANEPIEAELLRPMQMINNTIVVVGSHDNTLDVLADSIRIQKSDLTLSSSHVGSMGGLMALKKQACHLAGAHLLDVTDGSYNLSYIDKYLAGRKVKVVNLVLRDQGLIVPKGNPKQCQGISDLVRPDMMFINRQSGSGTRILLDYKLNQLKLDPKDIKGYQTEEYTHMSIAAAVSSGAADVGLGIYAAAKALDLDFIPVITEQYDLIIDAQFFDSENIQILLKTIGSDEFQRKVESLGGYSTRKTGKVLL